MAIINDAQARHIANWLYVVEAYLIPGEHIHQHLQLALFRFSEGKSPHDVANELNATLEETK